MADIDGDGFKDFVIAASNGHAAQWIKLGAGTVGPVNRFLAWKVTGGVRSFGVRVLCCCVDD
jgi:hypothetical protein